MKTKPNTRRAMASFLTMLEHIIVLRWAFFYYYFWIFYTHFCKTLETLERWMHSELDYTHTKIWKAFRSSTRSSLKSRYNYFHEIQFIYSYRTDIHVQHWPQLWTHLVNINFTLHSRIENMEMVGKYTK